MAIANAANKEKQRLCCAVVAARNARIDCKCLRKRRKLFSAAQRRALQMLFLDPSLVRQRAHGSQHQCVAVFDQLRKRLTASDGSAQRRACRQNAQRRCALVFRFCRVAIFLMQRCGHHTFNVVAGAFVLLFSAH